LELQRSLQPADLHRALRRGTSANGERLVKITRLEVSNLLRLKEVDVTLSPDGGTVTIAGKNAQGKTSFITAITAALVGPKAMADIDRPIRDGEAEASVTVHTEKYVVTRKWAKKETDEGPKDATSLSVTSADGAKYSSPQTLLNDVIGSLSFDPLAFANQDSKEQIATLLSLVALPFDPAELDRQRKGIYDERTEVGRELKATEGQLAGLPEIPEGTPEEEVSAASILEEQQAHQAAVTAWRHAGSAVIDERNDLTSAIAEVANLEEQLVRLAGRLETARAAVVQHTKDVAEADARAAAMTKPEEVDFTARIAAIEETNRHIRNAKTRARVEEMLAAYKGTYAELTASLAEVDSIKEDGLAAADMPIDGLSFDDSGVIYRGIPLKQASSAEQLRVSTAIAMAMNPEARIILIRDGSLLDNDNLALLDEMARDKDFQCLIERVGSLPDGTVGFEIFDGEVVA
jgi:DNA repair exonuclease SbcCD ATPase subunit